MVEVSDGGAEDDGVELAQSEASFRLECLELRVDLGVIFLEEEAVLLELFVDGVGDIDQGKIRKKSIIAIIHRLNVFIHHFKNFRKEVIIYSVL